MRNDFEDASWTCPFCSQKNWMTNGVWFCSNCGRKDPNQDPRTMRTYSGRD